MPIRYGGVTYPNLRYGGVNYPHVRYGGVTYAVGGVVPDPSGSSVTANLRDYTGASATRIQWNENVSIGTIFSGDGLEQIVDFFRIYDSGRVRMPIFGTNHRFTPEFEATGRFIVTASDGETVEFILANADQTETYDWTPINSAEVGAFVAHVRGLTDGDATLTLTDAPVVLNVAPAFADNTGNAQTWTQGFAISPITVPEATGTPAPTYAAVGALPAGIAFNPTTRVISGTPTAVGTGTIIITATNSAGTADWTIDYTAMAATVTPSFADDTGDAQTWTQNTAIAPITVPEATGDPVPTYAAVDLPNGVTFDAGTRVISGTPATAGSGTVTITATNSAGTDDWTVAYTIAAAVLTLRERLEGVASGSGNLIDVTLDNPIAGGNANQHYVYEHTPSFGTLNYVYPAAMFTDPGIFWNERPRFNFNGGTNDEYIVALHRGGSTVALNNYLPNLPDEWSWYVINTTDETWVSWQANVLNASGTAWAVYKGRVDGGGGVNVASPRSSDPLIVSAHGVMEWCFERVEAGDTMIMALIDSNTFDPYP